MFQLIKGAFLTDLNNACIMKTKKTFFRLFSIMLFCVFMHVFYQRFYFKALPE